MNVNDLIKLCDKIPNGRFFKIAWKTSCEKKMTAAARKSGIIITKSVEAVARKGIHYTHIKQVQDKKIENKDLIVNRATGEIKMDVKPREWAEDVIPNLLIKHKQTGRQYMLVYSTTTRPKVQYYLGKEPISIRDLKDKGYMQDSYWKNADEQAVVMTVPVDAITSIN